MARKGMGTGRGKGYKNLAGNDPKVHSQSAKGIKQPQKVSNIDMRNISTKEINEMSANKVSDNMNNKRLKFMDEREKNMNTSFGEMKNKDVGLAMSESLTEDDVAMSESLVDEEPKPSKFKTFVGRAGALAQKTGRKGVELGKKGVKALKEKKRKSSEKALSEINHPEINKLARQKRRVAELERQIENTTDTDKEDKLFEELDTEAEQLRQTQEKITNFDMTLLSDKQLKQLAINSKADDSFFGDLFNNDSNKYEAELERRIRKRSEVNRHIKQINKEERAKDKEKPDEGFF